MHRSVSRYSVTDGIVMQWLLLMIVTSVRSVLSRNGPVQITCYGNGEDAAKPEGSGGKL